MYGHSFKNGFYIAASPSEEIGLNFQFQRPPLEISTYEPEPSAFCRYCLSLYQTHAWRGKKKDISSEVG